ncbi:MAG: hypothetical protein JWP65_3523 [Ramlibacter sp.]|jgi:two-component system sensor histidine kinase QseC|uniref:histidine kinase dimerization/phospho-acceptor domain-containing protein n=1 Tax=Ramlibacter sp. TaxID=1917967 RepID=UPI002634F069|nr:histidine kinase dimerization/phospho-acceptor domain-containing protein [Ramlibacter sp.]MDB5753102.1 hypothetical protein [Ramlibacter sp.]
MKAPRLTNQLLAWILGSLVLVWGTFILMGYLTGEHEADELTDGHLASTASLLANLRGGEFLPGGISQAPAGALDLKAHDYQQSMNVVIWRADGSISTRSGAGPLPSFTPDEGFETQLLGSPPVAWRAFSKWDGPRQRKVTVLLALSERDALAQDIAAQIVEPGLWLLPVVALALGLAVHRGLRPLYSLSQEVHALDVRKPRRLPTEGRHQEFQASVDAINSLVERYQASLDRERALADEFAHELRTPLTSLSLQVQALRGRPDGPEREAALKRLEFDVLQTGEVIAQLLSLARASRTQLDVALETIELGELARSVVADFAPAAYASGHELSLDIQGPFQLEGHSILLELALRNLIDNALNHTPGGTQVAVQLLPAIGAIQVCDRPASMPTAAAGRARSQAGLGLGHRVVRKVADLHDARFEQVEPPAGFGCCYRITFGAVRQASGDRA